MDAEHLRLENGTVLEISDKVSRNVIGIAPYDATATYAVGDYCIHENYAYICTVAITTAEAWTATHWSQTSVIEQNNELKSNLTDLNASLTQKTTWVNVINETIGTGSQYDQTLTMTNMPNYTPNEIMFCLMRTSNNRIFASAIVPWGTWQGGAVYACGEFTLYSGQMNTAQIYHVNAVCIQKPNNQCEIAVESLAESIKVRVYVR